MRKRSREFRCGVTVTLSICLAFKSVFPLCQRQRDLEVDGIGKVFSGLRHLFTDHMVLFSAVVSFWWVLSCVDQRQSGEKKMSLCYTYPCGSTCNTHRHSFVIHCNYYTEIKWVGSNYIIRASYPIFYLALICVISQVNNIKDICAWYLQWLVDKLFRKGGNFIFQGLWVNTINYYECFSY